MSFMVLFRPFVNLGNAGSSLDLRKHRTFTAKFAKKQPQPPPFLASFFPCNYVAMLLFSFLFPAHLLIDKPSLTLPALIRSLPLRPSRLSGKNGFILSRTFTAKFAKKHSQPPQYLASSFPCNSVLIRGYASF